VEVARALGGRLVDADVGAATVAIFLASLADTLHRAALLAAAAADTALRIVGHVPRVGLAAVAVAGALHGGTEQAGIQAAGRGDRVTVAAHARNITTLQAATAGK